MRSLGHRKIWIESLQNNEPTRLRFRVDRLDNRADRVDRVTGSSLIGCRAPYTKP